MENSYCHKNHFCSIRFEHEEKEDVNLECVESKLNDYPKYTQKYICIPKISTYIYNYIYIYIYIYIVFHHIDETKFRYSSSKSSRHLIPFTRALSTTRKTRRYEDTNVIVNIDNQLERLYRLVSVKLMTFSDPFDLHGSQYLRFLNLAENRTSYPEYICKKLTIDIVTQIRSDTVWDHYRYSERIINESQISICSYLS